MKHQYFFNYYKNSKFKFSVFNNFINVKKFKVNSNDAYIYERELTKNTYRLLLKTTNKIISSNSLEIKNIMIKEYRDIIKKNLFVLKKKDLKSLYELNKLLRSIILQCEDFSTTNCLNVGKREIFNDNIFQFYNILLQCIQSNLKKNKANLLWENENKELEKVATQHENILNNTQREINIMSRISNKFNLYINNKMNLTKFEITEIRKNIDIDILENKHIHKEMKKHYDLVIKDYNSRNDKENSHSILRETQITVLSYILSKFDLYVTPHMSSEDFVNTNDLISLKEKYNLYKADNQIFNLEKLEMTDEIINNLINKN